MRHCRPEDGVGGRWGIEPAQEPGHLALQPFVPRCLEVHRLPAVGSGDHLHGSGGLIPPRADGEALQAAPAGGKQCRIPAEQPLRGQRLIVAERRIQH